MGNLFLFALIMLVFLFMGDNRLLFFILSLFWVTTLMIVVFCPDAPFHRHPPWEQGVMTGVMLWLTIASVTKVFRR
jgi:hypothetical protein